MQSEEIKQKLSDIQKIIQELTLGYQQIKPTLKAALLFGFSQEGKSTLLKFLRKQKLTAEINKYTKKDFKIKAVNPQEGVKIGDGIAAETHLPNLWQDTKNSKNFWDCPGFNDPRGPDYEIVNAFFITKIFQVTQEIKPVLVVSWNKIQGSATNFQSVIDKVTNLFAVPIQDLIASIVIIATKTSHQMTPQLLKEYLSEEWIKQQQTFMKNQFQLKLIRHIASSQSNLVMFPMPEKSGLIDASKSEVFQQLISCEPYLTKPSVRITINQKAKKQASQYAKILKNLIYQLMNEQLQKICKESVKKAHSSSMVFQKLKKIKQSLSQFENPQTFSQQTQKKLLQMIESYNFSQQHKKNLKCHMDFLKFICKINTEIQQQNLFDWKGRYQIIKLIQILTKQPRLDFKQQSSKLVIRAAVLGTSQVRQILEKEKTKNIKVVQIYCLHTFFVDSDLQAPGISFMVVANYWKIVGDRSISLKGKDGQDYQQPADSSQTNQQGEGIDGKDGKAGRCGQNGGSFYGKVVTGLHQTQFYQLNVDVSGGNGGKGQNGGNGGDGLNGTDAVEQAIESRDQKYLVARQPYTWSQKNGWQRFNQCWKTLGTFNGQMIETYRVKGNAGKKGGNPGKGGAGGFPGFPGRVQIKQINQLVIVADIGSQGQAGQPGNPGQGGINGRDFEAKYINQTVGTALRKQGKVIRQNQQQNKQFNQGVLNVIGTGAVNTVVTTVIQQGAQELVKKSLITQAAKKTTQFVAGTLSFTTSAVLQAGLSVISSYASSDWLANSRHYVDNGRAQNGTIPLHPNRNNQIIPVQRLQFEQKEQEQMLKCFYFEYEFCKIKLI